MPNLRDDYWRFLALKSEYPGSSGYLEIKSNWREALPFQVGPSGRLLRETLLQAKSILDVGAGDRTYESVFRNLGLQATYRSADLDRKFHHEYRDFLSVLETFDAITMFELIEHLDFDTGMKFFEHAYELLDEGGTLVLSTPNAHHPNHVWRIEVTHVRPWPAADLYGALRLAGFNSVSIYRQFLLGGTQRRLMKPIQKAMYRLMDLDHAQTVIVVARKQSTGSVAR